MGEEVGLKFSVKNEEPEIEEVKIEEQILPLESAITKENIKKLPVIEFARSDILKEENSLKLLSPMKINNNTIVVKKLDGKSISVKIELNEKVVSLKDKIQVYCCHIYYCHIYYCHVYIYGSNIYILLPY